MQVDKTIFPDIGQISEIDGIYSISPFYELNKKIPDSAALCLCKGFSDCAEVSPQGGRLSCGMRPTTQIFLVKGSSSVPDAGVIHYYSNGNAKWGYDATTAPAAAAGLSLITAFDITKICVTYFVSAVRNANDDTASTFTLAEYLGTYYSQYPYIMSIYGVFYAGEPGQRTVTDLHLIYKYDLSSYYSFAYSGGAWTHTPEQLLTYVTPFIDIIAGQPGSRSEFAPNGTVWTGNGNRRFALENNFAGNFVYSATTSYNTQVGRVRWYIGAETRDSLRTGLIAFINSVCPLYWADNPDSAKNAILGTSCTDSAVHFADMIDGTLQSVGYSGETIASSPRAVAWERSSDAPFNQSNYYGDDDNEYVDVIPITQPAVPVIGQFNKAYVMAFTHVADLASYLWSADSTRIEEILDGLKMYGENPINAIIDLRLYPFNLRALLPDTLPSPEFIKLGRAVSDAIGYPISNPYPVIDLGECEFYRYFGDFRDFPPYTTAELYIPYIGKIPLDPSVFAGHKVSVKLICDIITGAAVAMVYADAIPILYQSGVIGVSVPITGDNAAAYATSVISSVLGKIPTASKIAENVQTGVAAKSAGAVAGAVGMAAGAAADVAGAVFQPTQFQSAGSASPNCAIYQPQNCYITIYQAQSLETAGYGHNIGYACAEYGRIGDFNGYTVFANPDLTGITATGEELTQIAALLAGGIYV